MILVSTSCFWSLAGFFGVCQYEMQNHATKSFFSIWISAEVVILALIFVVTTTTTKAVEWNQCKIKLMKNWKIYILEHFAAANLPGWRQTLDSSWFKVCPLWHATTKNRWPAAIIQPWCISRFQPQPCQPCNEDNKIHWLTTVHIFHNFPKISFNMFE